MLVRPGRLLPSVIAGGLLVGSLTLGAGSAAAADPVTCTADGKRFEVPASVTVVSGATCPLSDSDATGTVTERLVALGYRVAIETPSGAGTAVNTAQQPVNDTATTTGSTGTTTGAAGSTAGTSTTGGTTSSSTTTGTTTGTATTTTGTGSTTTGAANAAPVVAPPAPAILPGPDVRGAPVAAPVAAAGGLLASRFPALGFGASNPTLNPSLLLAPTGSPLRTLAGQSAGSPVTTSSDVQALAVDGLPGGVGTPAVIGVLILASLGAFALRHTVLRRVRGDAGEGA